jgi:hypothetical protein
VGSSYGWKSAQIFLSMPSDGTMEEKPHPYGNPDLNWAMPFPPTMEGLAQATYPTYWGRFESESGSLSFSMDKKLDEELTLPLGLRKKANPRALLFTRLGENSIG